MPPFADYETALPQSAATPHHSDSSQSVARQSPDRSQPRNPAVWQHSVLSSSNPMVPSVYSILI